MEEVIVIPDVTELIQNNSLPEEIRAPDGTLLMKPYGTWGEQPLVLNRKVWRLFANYVPMENYPDQNRWIARVNTTGQIIENRDPDLASMLYYIRVINPGATIDEVVSNELARTVQETGPFKNDEEFMNYAFLLYLALALAIQHGLLILVK